MTLYFPELQHERAGSDRCERFGFARPMHTRAAVGQLLQGAAVMPFSRLLWRVLGEVGLADEVGGMEAGLRTVVGSGVTRLSGGSGPAVNSGQEPAHRSRSHVVEDTESESSCPLA